MLRLEIPNERHKAMWEEMIQTWKQGNYPIARQSQALFRYDTFEDFLHAKREIFRGEKDGFVPASFFFSISENRIVGHIIFRHHIEHPNFKEYGGHIAYAIVPWEQRKGYGSEQFRLVLEEARKFGHTKVMISCIADNIASEKIILSQGGGEMTEILLENPPEIMQGVKGKILRRYWITL